MSFDLSTWPEVNLQHLRSTFNEVPLSAYPELSTYDREGIHELQMGQGGLFLASDMAKLLRLKPGMRVLDLACGAGTTSIFLAKQFGASVYAVDENLPESFATRVEHAGVNDLITATNANARKLPFTSGFFDAVFCMNAFFYFGTDDMYPPYLLSLLKVGGELVIASPCYQTEMPPDIPEEFLLEFPACLAVHSPDWWRRHFEKTREVDVLNSGLHPRGVEFWDDRIRFLLESQRPADMAPWMRDMIYAMIRMRNRDVDGFVSHFMLHARKTKLRAPQGAAIS